MAQPDEMEIEAQYDEAAALVDDGVNPYPGMTYAQGVRDALGWVLDETDEPPLELP